MEIIEDWRADGRTLKFLTVLDECTHVFVRVEADTSKPALRVRVVLDSACATRGYPKAIRSDNGSQCAGSVMTQWAVEHGVAQVFIDSG